MHFPYATQQLHVTGEDHGKGGRQYPPLDRNVFVLPELVLLAERFDHSTGNIPGTKLIRLLAWRSVSKSSWTRGFQTGGAPEGRTGTSGSHTPPDTPRLCRTRVRNPSYTFLTKDFVGKKSLSFHGYVHATEPTNNRRTLVAFLVEVITLRFPHRCVSWVAASPSFIPYHLIPLRRQAVVTIALPAASQLDCYTPLFHCRIY